MRQLVVMRHAKAEPSGPSDHERRLTDRGLVDAAAAGHWLADHAVNADHALVSDATRTRQTWSAVAEAAGWPAQASYDEGLYAAGPATALDLVRAAPADARCLVVVGHNPTVAVLAQMLDDGEGEEDAITQMAMGYPTSALTVFDYDGEWSDLAEASATVTGFHVARG